MSAPFFRKEFFLHARNFRLSLGLQTKIMGILNLTPDSFSLDGIFPKNKKDLSRILVFIRKLISQGADIVDVGGESSRPGSSPIPVQEEIKRVIPVVKMLADKIKIPISVDTYKPLVVQHALDQGASIINNIKGITLDQTLLKMIQRYDAAIVLMHMRGNPKTMQRNTSYKNFFQDVLTELQRSVEKCLDIGIKSDKIIIDPGIGFGKTPAQNFALIQRLREFQILNCPILVGPSRKSFLGWLLQKEVDGRLMGTAAAVAVSVLNGAHMVRVHDVREMKDVVTICDAFLKLPTDKK